MQPNIHYKISGQGVPFIFQHGLGANLAQAQSLLGGLEKMQLISMDCPGHGNTPLRLGQSISFDFYVDELVRLMQHLHLERAIFGGISMGAGISINMALRYPEKVKALVLVRPAWLEKRNPQNLLLLKEAAKFIGKRTGKITFEQNKEYQQIKANLPTAAKSIIGVFGKNQQRVIPTVLKKMVGDKPFAKKQALKDLKVPCLVIGNEDDPLHPFSMASTIHKYIKESQLEKVVSRYVNNREHRITLTNLTQQFLNQHQLC